MRYLTLPAVLILAALGAFAGQAWAANIVVFLVWALVVSVAFILPYALVAPDQVLWLVFPNGGGPPQWYRLALAFVLLGVFVAAGWFVTAVAFAASLLALRAARASVEAHVSDPTRA